MVARDAGLADLSGKHSGRAEAADIAAVADAVGHCHARPHGDRTGLVGPGAWPEELESAHMLLVRHGCHFVEAPFGAYREEVSAQAPQMWDSSC